MKKTLLAAMAATLLFGSHAMAAKVTYEDAVASSSGFYEANNAVNIPPSDRGLGSGELQSSSSANQMGKWVKVSNTTNDWVSSGAYSVVLPPNAIGESCVSGSKGLIAYQTTERVKECHTMGSTGGIPTCVYYVWVDKTTTSSTKGYPAECR